MDGWSARYSDLLVENRQFFFTPPVFIIIFIISRRNFVKMFDADKTRMIVLPYGEKNYDNMLGRFYRAMLCKRGLCCYAVSVRLSVTFVSCAKTNKDIFEIFSPSGSNTILFFPYRRGCRYCEGNLPNGGVECKGYDKMTIFFTNISLYLRNGYS